MNKVFEKIIEKLESQKEYYKTIRKNTYCRRTEMDDCDSCKANHYLEARLSAIDDAIEIVKQETEKYEFYDTISIHTNGLEEGIRCAVCTNQIKSDTGCDGGCCVDENLVKRICDVIHNFECKPY